VGPALELEHRVGAVATDLERDLLEPADLGRRLGEHVGGKAALLGVASQHLEQVAREQRRLVAAGAGADLDDHVLGIVGIALDHRQADLVLERAQAVGRLGDQAPQLLVVAVLREQLARPLEVAPELAPLAGQLPRRLELAVLATDLGVALPVGDHLRIRHLSLELLKALLNLVDQLLDHAVEATAVAPRISECRPACAPPSGL
jgi:hypothetical protein